MFYYQVLKTNHAPENLIPSAKPLSRDLARQILPDDMQVCSYHPLRTSSRLPSRSSQTICKFVITTPSELRPVSDCVIRVRMQR
jgi:hypothetical protein